MSKIDTTLNRPPCPYCKGTHIVSNGGGYWRCESCGRSWRKKPVPKQFDYSDRPECPTCGAKQTASHNASRWYCTVCGRTWSKIKPPKQADPVIIDKEVRKL